MDTQSATWHPAKMPLSNYDSHQTTTTQLDEPRDQPVKAIEEHTTDHSNQNMPNTDIVEEGSPAQPMKDGAFLDQFDNDDAGAAAWDLSDPSPAPAQPAPQGDDTFESSYQDDIAQPESVPTGNLPKHSSRISFARTVSHEVSFGDDEDTEWNLQRTDTDPFKFMPPSDRTNSFPAVPHREDATEDLIEQPPPSTQAQDIIQDLENDDSHADLVAQSDFTSTFNHDHATEDFSPAEGSFPQYVGGDLVGAEEEESDARFEEGLPLIPQNEEHAEVAEGYSEPHRSNPGDAFTQDDAAEGDDFFNQVSKGDSQLDGDGAFDRTLLRKSSTMAMGDDVIDSEVSTPIDGPAPKAPVISDAHSRDIVNGDSKPQQEEEVSTQPSTQPGGVDIDAKWAAAFDDDDDDFLDSINESRELDPAEIFGSDDEGFLEETTEETPAIPAISTYQPNNMATQPHSASLNGRYTPENLQYSAQPPVNPYAPTPAVSQIQPQYPSYAPAATAPPPAMGGYGQPPPKPTISKAQSFADKSKGGYTSPYDLPMEVVKPPKKRISLQQLPRATQASSGLAPPSGPPRSASMNYQPPPSGGSSASLSPPSSSHSSQPPPPPSQKATPQLKSKGSFFEDLPMASKPRPASRHNNPLSPPQQSPYGQLQGSPTMHPLPPPHSPQLQATGVASLVPPERPNPYASLQSQSPPKPIPPPAANSRYSPAPAQLSVNGIHPPPAASRYSPAPSSVRSSSGGYTAVPPPILAHQPRTSSPLAHSHFEVSHDKTIPSPNGEVPSLSRNSSSQYEPRLTRVPSLPPTQEVEEEPSLLRSPPTAPKPSSESRYSPGQAMHTPPLMSSPAFSAMSPPKRSASSYVPLSPPIVQHKEVNFVPPPRPQTQSPGAVYGNRTSGKPVDSVPRPSSVQGTAPPREMPGVNGIAPVVRARGMSQHLNLVPPTDGRELDPLQRWRGAPVVSWGVGGTLVTSFPTDVPRYGISQALPMIVRSPGEVKVKHIKDIQPLEERLAKFPGPLKSKSKKKETLAWLSAGIDGLESNLPNVSFHQTVSHEDKRAIERVLLWKILRVFVENDGLLEGNPTVDKAVMEVITPGLDTDNPELASAISTGVDLTGISSPVTGMQADAVDSTVTEQIRHHLLSGDREKAVWAAVDKRLWGHAMLISNAMQSPDLYKKVAQEFIKKEVNHPGRGNESLAALYGVLSGNFEESVDELVPVHARAGLQLMSTSASIGASQDALAGLDKWRETLGLILSNRSFSDAQALKALGNLLSGYGRAEAAHICYIFARNCAVFGGLDDPNANFVLVGADHRRQADQFAKETEALQLSEVYEYGLLLAGSTSVVQSCSHLAAYKLQHAMTLAEYGYRDKALAYCESIYNAIVAQTKKSPYFNPVLETAVDDLMQRLKQAPKEESSSWIPKPRMDQVSTNMWSRFNKFVAGDDDDNAANGASGDAGAESGPFARLAGGTPTISRSPSVSNFEVYGNGGPSPTAPATKAASRYAPMTPHDPYNPAPRSSMERTSGEMSRSSLELPPRRGSDMQSAYGNPYAPQTNSSPASAYQPAAPVASQTSPYAPASRGSDSAPQPTGIGISFPGYDPYGAAQTSPNVNGSQPQSPPAAELKPEATANVSLGQGYQPSSYGYEPPSMTFETPVMQTEGFSGGYEPPSFQPSSFEPPSYEPGPSNDDGDDNAESKPKKKSFMDDDDDDIPSMKSKADKDRENEEMVRRVAEEEEKRAAEAKAAKKGWGFGGWFSGGKKESLDQANKPIKAKLGEASSFVYDPDLKRWVNKKPGAENTPAKAATPPPPRSASRTGTPPPPGPTSAPPPPGGLSIPPAGPPRLTPSPALISKASTESLLVPGAPPMMMRSVSNQSTSSAPGGPINAPPSRPTTSLSNASSIDDLLGAAGSGSVRRGAKKGRKSGRYVDVMAK
ncbi:Sec23-binding domain of Sec16-domain-containing protein [Annulohypoxylon maeteangense]|uniref:Sec23-binding domain of Sec16-domain-containing protein n=1 Tax=Annulohypoxylon maeteangense TaxID=1927788 RepID=UPI002007DF53|nr:Sec23-binding domain of Sec16-domain-containing protein [Annulohypoxylon maeteangense]KAI0883182.1 Sec23-binding domain of Sec16-domain-containing protein [Annulohypoxylon maeteangense]